MTSLRAFRFLALLVCVTAAPAVGAPLPRLAPATNLVQLPGFEGMATGHLTAKTRPWVGEEPNIVSIVNDGHAHSGSLEALIVSDGVASGQLMQMLSVQANTDYQASAWIGGTPGFTQANGFLIAIPFDDHDGDGDTGFDAYTILQSLTVVNNSTGGYQFYHFNFNSGSHTQLFIKVGMDEHLKAGTTLRVDDVSVVINTSGGAVAPSITSQPANRTVTAGQTATFSVTATGTAPLAYQWQKNGTNISGATSSSYTTPATALADSGETFRVVVSNAAGTVTSAAATLTVGAPSGGGSLPAPWKDGDVGSVGVPGSATESGGVFTVKGSGADIGGTADSFNFASQQLGGDITFKARVSSLGNVNSRAQAGLMIRETLDPSSPWVDMLITPTGVSFQGRSDSGSSNWNLGGPSAVAPYWLKITRSGNTFTGSTSADGTTWSVAGTATVSMPSEVFVGFAVTSHNNGVLDVATFDSVSLTSTGAGALPSPWVDGDIGAVGVAGSAAYSNGTFTIKGAGADIGGTADGFNYVHQPLAGDGMLTAHVTTLGATSPKAQAGVMIRETLDAGSKFADMLITPQNGASFQGRVQVGSSNFNDGGTALSPPSWIRIVRTGNTFTGYTSGDGKTWTARGSAEIPMATTVLLGLAVTSCNNSVLDTATIDGVSR